jgi:hypothetical protein
MLAYVAGVCLSLEGSVQRSLVAQLAVQEDVSLQPSTGDVTWVRPRPTRRRRAWTSGSDTDALSRSP